MPVRNEISILELNQEEVTASAEVTVVAHHEPQVCAVLGHLLSYAGKERLEEPPQPTQEQLVAKVAQEAGFSKRSDVVNSLGRDRNATLTEDTVYLVARNLTNQDLSKTPGYCEFFQGEPEIGPVMDTCVSEDQGLICTVILVPTELLMVDTCTGTRKQRSHEIGTSKREYVEPDTQGIDVGFVKEGTTGQPDSAMLGIGRPIAAPSQIPPPTSIDRLHPGQPEIARPCIGRPISSQLPASSSNKPLLTPDTPLVGLWYNNYNSDPLDICIRE